MCWLIKLSGAILILSIVKKSFCDIPTCDYFDTVDISHLQRVNDSYMYKGIEIPANLTGEYNYRKLIYDDTEPVISHLRACICKYRPCVRICCPRKNVLANEKCNDDLPEEIILSMLNLTLENIYKGELWRPATPISAEFLVLRNQFHSYEEMINLREDEYSMLKDGTLIIKTLPIVLYKEQYCLYPQFNADFPKSISIVKHSRGFKLPPGITEVTVVSLICYVLTILVYLYVNKHRNVLGKCFISCLCGMIMNGFTFILDKLSLLHKICALAGYSRYFFLMASFLWVSMISFHLRKILTSKDRSENRNQFLKYSIIVWGIAALATGVIFGMNQVWEQDVHKWSWMPLVGYSECAVKASGPSSWFYLNGPILILNTFSVVMYILIHIWRTKTELKRFQKGGKRITSCFDFDTETNLMLLRLSVLIEVFWILDFMFSYVDIHSIAGLFHSLPIYFHHSFGILVFIMIILN